MFHFCSVEYLLKLEQNLRAFCLKLLTSASYLQKLPEDATFSIQLHTTELANVEFNDNPAFEASMIYVLAS